MNRNKRSSQQVSRIYTDETALTDDKQTMRRAWTALSVISFASIIAGIQNSAINVALPTIVRDLNADSLPANLTILGFMLTQTILMIVFGRLADMVGRRKMYLTGVALFSLASILCGLSPSIWFLVGFRVLQAAAAAMLLSNSGAIVTSVFPGTRLGEGMGLYLASFSIAQLLGPSVGGLLTEIAGWRFIFFFNAPLGIICVIWGLMALQPTPNAESGRSFDVPGTGVILVGLTGGLGAFSYASSAGWLNNVVAVGLILFFISLPIFLLIESKTADPIVDLNIFKLKGVSFGMVAALFHSSSRFGLVVLMTLYFQVIENIGAFDAGLKILPLAVFALLGSSTSGFLQRVSSVSAVALAGNLSMLCGLSIILACVMTAAEYQLFVLGLAVCGYGTGLFSPSNTTAIMREIPDQRLGIANAMRLMIQNTGLVAGSATILSALTSALPSGAKAAALSGNITGLQNVTNQTLAAGYSRAVVVMILLICMTIILSLLGLLDRRS